MRRRGRRAARLAGIVALLLVAAGAVFLREPILERYYILRLDHEEFAVREEAAERLGDLGSTRAIPRLLELVARARDRGAEKMLTTPFNNGNVLFDVSDLLPPSRDPILETRFLELVDEATGTPQWRIELDVRALSVVGSERVRLLHAEHPQAAEADLFVVLPTLRFVHRTIQRTGDPARPVLERIAESGLDPLVRKTARFELAALEAGAAPNTRE